MSNPSIELEYTKHSVYNPSVCNNSHLNLLWQGSSSIHIKYRRIGVPMRHSPSRRISKVCALSRVEAWFWNPKIVFTRSTDTSPVRKWSNTKVNTQILIRVRPNFLKFTTPNNTRLSSFFRTARRGRVIRRSFQGMVEKGLWLLLNSQ